jgi:two-component system secretion response regulator SsrB
LLADDYLELLKTFERLLAPDCDVVGCVADDHALLEATTRLQPDVVVLDLFMRSGNGLEMCRDIKRVVPETQVVIMSAYTDQNVWREALGAGASAFVAKLSAANDLLPAIHEAIAARG